MLIELQRTCKIKKFLGLEFFRSRRPQARTLALLTPPSSLFPSEISSSSSKHLSSNSERYASLVLRQDITKQQVWIVLMREPYKENQISMKVEIFTIHSKVTCYRTNDLHSLSMFSAYVILFSYHAISSPHASCCY